MALFIAFGIVMLNLLLKPVCHLSNNKTAFNTCNTNNCQTSDLNVRVRLAASSTEQLCVLGFSRPMITEWTWKESRENPVSIYSKFFGLVVMKVILTMFSQPAEGLISSLSAEFILMSSWKRGTSLMRNGNCDYHIFLPNISTVEVERILLRYF